MTPGVSCIIPTHLRADLLAEALVAIERQTSPPLEVIVVSDVDDPASAEACRAAADRGLLNLQYVRSDGPPGAAASRNAGAARSTGDLLAFLDDDDLWAPTYLEEAVGILVATGADMAVTWLSKFSGDDERPGQSMPEGLKASDAAVQNPGATGTNVVVRREAFVSVGGYDPHLRVKNDTDFLYRFLMAGRSYAVNHRRLARQRKHGQGQLMAMTEARAVGTLRYAEKHRETLTPANRYQLRLSLHQIRSWSAPTAVGRTAHLAMVALYSPRRLLVVLRHRRNQEFYAPAGSSTS